MRQTTSLFQWLFSVLPWIASPLLRAGGVLVTCRDRGLTSLCDRRDKADDSDTAEEWMAGIDAHWLL
eukprot:1619171-Amphidinium_carterae.1